MNEDDRIDAIPDEKQSDVRTPRGIRFSDAEWAEVKMAAAKQAIPAAELVRDAALSLARDKATTDSAAIPPGIVALIERTYRSTYILSTLKRDEMIQEGRGQEMDEMIAAARKAQDELLSCD